MARCGIRQARLWLDVAWRGLMPVDVSSPISLAPLTFGEHERRPQARHSSRPERLSGSNRGQRASDAQPQVPRRGSERFVVVLACCFTDGRRLWSLGISRMVTGWAPGPVTWPTVVEP
jgi:hypothetical protein